VAVVSKGIPRVINAVCDNALLAAFAEGSSQVLDKHVRAEAAILDLGELPHREEKAVVNLRSLPPVPAPNHLNVVRFASEPKSSEPKSSRWARWAGRLRLNAPARKHVTS
jgi:hypothetical protein